MPGFVRPGLYVASLFPPGQDQPGNVIAGVVQFGERCSSRDLDIIGMCSYGQDIPGVRNGLGNDLIGDQDHDQNCLRQRTGVLSNQIGIF